ncbi:MAG: restriction endonuclease [Burkholderiales bacterium]|nr:restriction endonuclease [Phycisphaerae bacterium]
MTTEELLATATSGLSDAKASERNAIADLKQASRQVRIQSIRLAIARTGIPAWVAMLIAGSAAAFVSAMVQIFVVDAGLPVLLAGLIFAYAIFGGAAFYVFRSKAGEDDVNRVQIRTRELESAKARLNVSQRTRKERAQSVALAQQHLASIQSVLNSAAHRHEAATNRLLNIDPGRLYPDEFERYVADIFTHLGYSAETVGASGDQGVDVVACKGPLRLAIQAKRHQGAVGNSAVQEVYAGMAHRKCHHCIVVTNSSFTTAAIALAESTGCMLIGGDSIHQLIRGELSL